MTLTHLSLFTGIGGIDLACERAGFRTVAQVEKDGYCRRVLARHWPDVPRFDDVRDVTARSLREAGIERPTLVSGGFPCQPYSCAGKRRGAADDRALWPEMRRIVSELRPPWVLGENVAGFVSMALDDVCLDLERLGYAVRAFVVPAAGVGAPHMRARCFVVAHAARLGRREGRAEPAGGFGGSPALVGSSPLADAEGTRLAERGGRGGESPRLPGSQRGREDVAHPMLAGGREGRRAVRIEGRLGGEKEAGGSCRPGSGAGEGLRLPQSRVCRMADGLPAGLDGNWPDEWPGVPRVATGVPNRVARLRALGNAVVPMQVFPFVQAIAEIETTAPAAVSAGTNAT